MSNVPVVCNNLWLDRASALGAPKGNIDLTFCDVCGHCFNSDFQPKLLEYGENYETSLHFSEHFRTYARTLALRLIDTYDLRERTIIELGCGQAEFLAEICRLGNNAGLGFDQSFDRSSAELPDCVQVFPENFSPEFEVHSADFFCCRHVLEHVPEPATFITPVKQALKHNPGAIAYFEVPNGLFTLEDLGIWDLIYEHCSYFWSGSLSHLFKRCGFEVLRVEPAYDRQFLSIDLQLTSQKSQATKSDTANGSALSNVTELADRFSESFHRKCEFWKETRRQLALQNKTAAIWGAGSKGVTFLNLTQGDGERDRLPYAVDISPRKHGKFIPGTGQEIVPPWALKGIKPDVIYLMNATYENEIRAELKSLGVTAQLLIV